MRQSNILIVCFIIFILAFVGYSLWRSNTLAPLSNVNEEQQQADLKLAEKYLHDAEPERSLPIIHKYKKEMESNTSEGSKWLKLFVAASTDLNNTHQLTLIYQFRPDILKENEKGALTLADLFLKAGNLTEYNNLRNLWTGREEHAAAWILLDAGELLQKGQMQQAYELLKDKKWNGKNEEERLMRIAIIKLQHNPQEALDILNAEFAKNPKNADLRLFRGKIYESQDKIPLAEQDFQAAANLEPHNFYLQDQLAEFYRRQKNYSKALTVWQKILAQSGNDQIWIKALFWNRVAEPINYVWKHSPIQNEKHKPFMNYLLSLKAGEYWNQDAFESTPENLDALSEYQTTYWLRLLQALKNHDEQEAMALLENNPFEANSWAPLMEITLHRILNYRKNSTLRIEGEIPHSEPILGSLSSQNSIPNFYKELEQLAHQEVNLASLNLPTSMQALLNNQEAFVAVLLSEGWTEAGLQLQTLNAFSADFPDWFQRLYINGLRQNRGNPMALKFIAQQKQTLILTLLKAEINIAEGKIAEAMPELEKLKSNTNDIGSRAAWLISLIYMQKGQYRLAGEAINMHPQLAYSIQGQETLGRIALMEGEPEVATQIYQKIVQESNEAKSFLARQAYQQKNWSLARRMTEELLDEFPGNAQLQENLKKIIVLEQIQSR